MASSRAAKRTAWLAAVGLAAAATPPALAAEGGAPPLPDATTLAAGIIEQAGAGDPLPTLPIEQPLAHVVELPAAPAQQAAAEPVQTGADAAPPPLPDPEPEPVAEPVPEAAPSPAAPQPDAPPPVAVQQEPANVNVSIRIDSPGDDGAVTQVNVAVDTGDGQYQPDAPQYQPDPAAPDAPEANHTAPESTSTWSWNWDCGGAGLPSVTLPSGAVSQDWNWIWDWNCGGDAAPSSNNSTETNSGYHPVPVQYRPVNINISIRINSPGSNGSVTQTNVAVGVAVPLPAPVVAPPASIPVPAVPAPAISAPGEPAAAPAEAAAEAAPVEPAPVEEPLNCCLLPESRGLAPAPERPASILAGGSAATATGIASLPGDTVAVAARLELQVRRAATAAAAPQRPQLRPAPRSPQRRTTDEEPSAVAQSGFGIVPVGGPERNLPFAALVLLAFAFASANSSLASVRSRPTHGADADEPPDRPG